MIQPDFATSNGKSWIRVRVYDIKGLQRPHNFRAEICPGSDTPEPVCCRVDEAWQSAHLTAKFMGMQQTRYGAEHEALDKQWAKEHYNLDW